MPRSALQALLAASVVAGCSSGGTLAASMDAGADATTEASPGGDDAAPVEAGDDGEAAPPCLDLDASLPVPSDDCVYAGHCPASCAGGTSSAYLCNGGPDGAATYPSVFLPPADLVDILSAVPNAYPWDASAFLSCASLTCTRWATADHVDGGSAWAGDPCATTATDAGPVPYAWACPLSPGVIPPVDGCVSAGDSQELEDDDAGLPANAVWCCPLQAVPLEPDGGAPEASTGAGDASGE